MSASERSGQIRLSLDQEIFIEEVRSGDAVDDANVATEVTSFERVGDTFVLEGAVVFAGWLTSGHAGSDWPYATDGAGYGRQFYHRMPFMLRVPTAHQPRGLVDVTCRISDWRLEVAGDGWLRIEAELLVTGMNGHHGYHFRCGSQEDGDPGLGRRFEKDTVPVAPEAEPGTEPAEAADAAPLEAGDLEAAFPTRGATDFGDAGESLEAGESADDTPPEPAEEEGALVGDRIAVQLTGGTSGLWRSATDGDGRTEPPEDSVESAVVRLSDARGSAGDASPADSASASMPEEADSEPVTVGERRDLATLDRRFAAVDGTQTPEPRAASNDPAEAEAASDATGPVEFEFEHQLDGTDVETGNPTEGAESFSPSRGFTDATFHAASGFVPTVNVGAAEPSETGPADASEEASRASTRGSGVDASLWSFVDFNAPDARYTLRYLVVGEEESLEAVASRAGCSEDALMEANHLRGDGVYPGMVLRVPERKPPELPIRFR